MSRRENHRLSRKQLAARRNNAQKSIGPRTAAGKRRSALNSLKHARYAKAPARPIVETIVALGGDPKAFTPLLLSVIRFYAPVASPDANLRREARARHGVPLPRPSRPRGTNLQHREPALQDVQKRSGGKRT